MRPPLMKMNANRREFPRVETEFLVEIVQPNGKLVPAGAVNISQAGLQLACDRPTAERIVKEARQVGQGHPAETDVKFALPFADGARRPVEAHCQIIWSKKVEENSYRIGIRFLDVTGQGDDALTRFIEESMLF
jgi:hypothetical protein